MGVKKRRVVTGEKYPFQKGGGGGGINIVFGLKYRDLENGGKKGAKGPKYKEKIERKDIKGRIWRKGIRKGAKGQSMEKR